MRNSKAQLAHFFYLFQVVTDCGLGWFGVMYYFSSTFARISFHLFPESISEWRIARTKLWEPFSNFAVSYDTLALNSRNVLSFSKAFLQFLNFHIIVCLIFTFSVSILESWDHRLNYDAHSFSAKIIRTSVGWGYNIHWLHDCRAAKLTLNEWIEYDIEPSDGDLVNVEYAFISIAFTSTLTRSGSTWKGLSYGSNRINSVQTNDWF